MGASEIFTFCYLRSQGIELLRRRLGYHSCGEQLPFTNCMHDFYTSNLTPGRPKGLEAERRTRQPFHRSMILLYDIIEIFRVADDNRGLVRRVVVLNRCRVAPTLIDRDFLRQSLGTNGLA